MHPHRLSVLEGAVAVCRRDPADGIPGWFGASTPICSLITTEQELTLVVPERQVPAGEEAEGGWRVLRVEGPFELRTTFGVIAGVTAPLAAAEISVLSISTYDTDYLLVQDSELERAVRALRQAGHEVS